MAALYEHRADLGKRVVIKQLFEGGFYENAESLAHFKYDVAGEAVGNQNVRISLGNFAALDVADKV